MKNKGDGSIFPEFEARKIEPSPLFQLARGFTLVELILVVVVIITLASIAIPNYGKAKQRAIQKEGLSNLKLLAAAERIYRMEKDGYGGCVCNNAADCNETMAPGCNFLLRLTLNTANWSYGVQADAGAATITATQLDAPNCWYNLVSDDFDTEDFSDSGNCI